MGGQIWSAFIRDVYWKCSTNEKFKDGMSLQSHVATEFHHGVGEI